MASQSDYLLVILLTLSSILCRPFLLSGTQIETSRNNSSNNIRILALFTGTKSDLGLDQRLGRQVLKLARNKVIQSNPSLEDSFEILVYGDDSDCNRLSNIPNEVAEQFYGVDKALGGSCSNDRHGKLSKITKEQSISAKNQQQSICSRGNNSGNEIQQQQYDSSTELFSIDTDRANDMHFNGKQIHAILGPGCDHLVDLVGRMAVYWRVPMFTTTSINGKFAQKDVYSTLTRLSPSIDQLSMFIIKLMAEFKWRHLAVLMDQSQIENLLIHENLNKAIAQARYSYPIESQLFFLDNHSQTSSSEVLTKSSYNSTTTNCHESLAQTLDDVQKVARVLLLLVKDSQSIRQLLLCAHELQMNNGEYTFLAVNLGLKTKLTSDKVDSATTTATSSSAFEQASSRPNSGLRGQTIDWFVANDGANNIKARQMFESLMILSVELPIGNEFQYFVEQTLEASNKEYPNAGFDHSSIGPVAVALHDSLLLAVEAIKRSRATETLQQAKQLSFNESNNKKDFIGEQDEPLQDNVENIGIWNQRLTSSSLGFLMREMQINSNGDQELDYILSDLEPELGVMRPVAMYSRYTREIQILPNSYIHWPARRNSETKQLLLNDEPPPDEPECGFTGQAERCIDRQNLYVALSLVAVLTLLLMGIGLLIWLRYKQIQYQMKLDDYWWNISWSDLKFVQLKNIESGGSGLSGSLAMAAPHQVGSVSAQNVARQIKMSERAVTSAIGSIVSSAHSTAEARKQTILDQRRQAVPLIVAPDLYVDLDKRRDSRESDAETLLSGSKSKLNTGHFSASSLGSASSACVIRSEYSTLIKSSALAAYKHELVIVKSLNANSIDISRQLLIELKAIRELVYENLAKFVGLCIEPNHLAIVYEYCSRGSLQELLLNKTFVMDWNLKYSIIGDIVNGLNFIHTTLFEHHGRLKSTNLVLDSRFTVKLTDFGLKSLYSQLDLVEENDEEDDEDDSAEDDRDENGIGKSMNGADQRRVSTVTQTIYNMDSVSIRAERMATAKRSDFLSAPTGKRNRSKDSHSLMDSLKNRRSARFFWTAPEHLRDRRPHLAGSKRGDIYSLGIIFFEIFSRREPYYYGTNAKPRWSCINKERRQQMSSRCGSGQAAAGLHSANAMSVRQHMGRRVSGMSRASVGPMSTIGGPDKPQATNESVISARSSMQKQQQVAINVSAARDLIEEEEQEERSQQKDEIASVCSSATSQNRRKSKQISRLGKQQSSATSKSKEEPLDAAEILDQLRMGIQPEPIRPYMPNHMFQDIDPKLVELMRSCWLEMPASRPTVGQVRARLRKITHGATAKNYLDNLLERLQSYANQLEQIVDTKSADIVAEKVRTEDLLYQLLPRFVADKLKRSEPIIPQVFDCVTIFFSDIVGFEKYASVMSPCELVDLLNNIYSSFESIISSFDVTKIEVILDQFLVAGGISLQDDSCEPVDQQQLTGTCTGEVANVGTDNGPVQCKRQSSLGIKKRLTQFRSSQSSDTNENANRVTPKQQSSIEQGQQQQQQQQQQSLEQSEHFKRASAEQIARMALCIRDLVKSFHFRQNLGSNPTQASVDEPAPGEEQVKKASSFVAATFNIRIGIHSGKVCAGIVGVKRPKFCLIGDTVNVASRMHTNSKANRIQVSATTKELLKQVPGFKLEPRGRIEIKGKGLMETFWLESFY